MKKDLLKKFLKDSVKILNSDISYLESLEILDPRCVSKGFIDADFLNAKQILEFIFGIKIKNELVVNRFLDESLFFNRIFPYRIKQKYSKSINPKTIRFNMLHCPKGVLISENDVGIISSPNVKYYGNGREIDTTNLMKKQINIHIETNGFWLGEIEVTQDLWESIMGWNSASNLDRSHSNDMILLPMENITWFDTLEFCNRLSKLMGYEQCFEYTRYNREEGHIVYMENLKWNKNANGFRLPIALEWFYAAKANCNFDFVGSNDPFDIAWPNMSSAAYYETNAKSIYPSKLFEPNAWGFYDMNGNVSELVLNITGMPQTFIMDSNTIVDINMLDKFNIGSFPEAYALGGNYTTSFADTPNYFGSGFHFFDRSTNYNKPNVDFKFKNNNPNSYMEGSSYDNSAYVIMKKTNHRSDNIGFRLARNG